MVLDCKALAAQIKKDIRSKVPTLYPPKLGIVVVGNNPASRVYVNGKKKDCLECNIEVVERQYSEISEQKLIKEIQSFQKEVNGIIVQLPLPANIDENKVIAAIDPEKDLDGFSLLNRGKLVIGQKCFTPCTPAGILEIIKYAGIDLRGKKVCIAGRSNIVGKPLMNLLLNKDATVTICHSKTKDIKQEIQNCDIFIAAIGKRRFFTKDYFENSSCQLVIDVGINRDENGKICGDVDFENVKDIVPYITPVPGGVGLLTRAMLLKQLVDKVYN